METLEELLTEQIQDLYDAEKQLVKALPKFSKAASNPELRAAFDEHLETTRGQVKRLEEVFSFLEQKPKSKPCAAMKGLLEEGQEIIGEKGPELLRDSAMIGVAQKVEHYEISGYGTVRTLAEKLGLSEVADLLEQTLTEEKDTDEKLTGIAKQILDAAALEEEDGDEEEDEDEEGEDEDDDEDEDFEDDEDEDLDDEEETDDEDEAEEDEVREPEEEPAPPVKAAKKTAPKK